MTVNPDDPLRVAPEADALEQRQTVVDDSAQDVTPTTPPLEVSEADVAEQGAPPAGEQDSLTALPEDANPADALEQRESIIPADEDHRD
ncbi:hypothetical protein E1211_12315 [Micromonospora sp. 15K316]|uniref:hypothetical protein n=1 Tax=Micromonospora sp. 15K316 TaxID=2530376 RepID=UPI001047A38F|nr:hypothetical protein [Micromonospora sp. 15K316]TDC36817.1 hypothetical protein E1211_12315 [Micromonospora sp. 15K316]